LAKRPRGSPMADLPVAEGLRQAYRLQVLLDEIRENEIQEIFTLLRSAGIQAILVKGWSVATHLRGFRTSSLRGYRLDGAAVSEDRRR
jgi:hypothetical protein